MTKVIGVGLAAAAEAGLYWSYQAHEARFHWFVHLAVAACITLLAMSVIASRTRRPVRLPLLWVVLVHVFAMAPDFAFQFGYPHQKWMDVFAIHLIAHGMPGRLWGWEVMTLACLAGYLYLLELVSRPTRVPTGTG